MTENANDRFERLADAFHKATGRRFLAPGKDDPLAREEGEVERALRWAMFVEGVQYGEAARAAPREPGEAERELFRWEQRLKILARDAYDEIESTTANTDVKHGANRGVQALARRVLKKLAAPRPDAGDGTGETT